MNLVLSVSNVTQGQFEYTTTPQVAIYEFLQLSVLVSSVQFVQNGSETPPTFAFSVNDGSITTGPKLAEINFNYQPRVNPGGFFVNQTVIAGQPFDFTVNLTLFTDPNNDNLTYLASQLDKRELPSTMTFDNSSGRFTGSLDGVSEMGILVTASDPWQLSASSSFTIHVSPADSSSWLLTIFTPAAFLSVLTAAAGYGYNRYRIWEYRQSNENLFAEYLRKALNLEIYDFSSGQGMDYAILVKRMMSHLNDKRQFSCQELPKEQMIKFASVMAQVIREGYRGMVQPALCSTRFFNLVTCYGKRWVNQMAMIDFGLKVEAIADQALQRYQQQPNDNLDSESSASRASGSGVELKRSATDLSQPLLEKSSRSMSLN